MADTKRIYVPFQLSEGIQIGDPIPFSGEVAGYAAELKGNEPHYSIALTGISSEREAIAQFERLVVGLYWVALETRYGLLVQQQLQKVHYPDDPDQAARNIFGEDTDRRAEVVFDGSRPAIWPDGKRAIKVMAGPVKGFASYNPSRFLQVLDEGTKLPCPKAVLEASKLKLALDLYCLAHFRASDFARFLVLWTVLEAAAPETSVTESVAGMIDRWIAEAKEAQSSTVRETSAQREELDSLVGSLRHLKKRSHSSRSRRYVKTMLEMDGHSDADQLAREVGRLYSVRGKLTHQGKYELGNSLSRLDEIVCKTLKAAMRHACR